MIKCDLFLNHSKEESNIMTSQVVNGILVWNTFNFYTIFIFDLNADQIKTLTERDPKKWTLYMRCLLKSPDGWIPSMGLDL